MTDVAPGLESTPSQRWLARLRFVLAGAAIVILVVVARLKSLAMLAVGLAAPLVSLAAAYVFLSRQGQRGWLSLAVINGQTFVNNASFGACAEIVETPAHRGDKLNTTPNTLPDLLPGDRRRRGGDLRPQLVQPGGCGAGNGLFASRPTRTSHCPNGRRTTATSSRTCPCVASSRRSRRPASKPAHVPADGGRKEDHEPHNRSRGWQ